MDGRGGHRAPAPGVPVFNQVDRVSESRLIIKIADSLAGEPALRQVVFTDARQPAPVKYIFNLSSGRAVPEVSCILLAAGFSRRMGCDKLALKLGGTTVLEQTLQNLAGTGISEIIGVINPESAGLGARLLKYGARVVVNERSYLGIAGSLKAGLSAASAVSQGALFALGDQPLIPARVYEHLLENYRLRLPLAAYPTCRGRRGNPVLFDRRTWPLLAKLEGDRGGSQLLGALPAGECCPVEMDMEEIAVDLDTPDDYEQVLGRIKSGPDA